MLDWMPLPLQPEVLDLPTIQLGVEIQPLAFVLPAVVVTDSVTILIDLVAIDLR